ncbi:MAG: nucleotidyltransferase family protein [Rhodospirillaceae bacterium]|nr:nucleotidyltransferase family protein [Rhodospirillaceae bacterium]
MTIHTAMLLAAGLGTRMRPITDHTPKPLVKVGGKSLIDYTLDQLAAAKVPKAVVNVHHLAPLLVNHLKHRAAPAVSISDETAALLDTGGGVVKALPLLGGAPFFVFNCDAIIADGKTPMIDQLTSAWDDKALDVLMLVHPRATAYGFDGAGDFFVENGVMRRRGAAKEAPYVYAGAYILHPRALAGETPTPFSMNRIWDRAIAASRMRAVIHDGAWYHVGTPEAVTDTDALLARV